MDTIFVWILCIYVETIICARLECIYVTLCTYVCHIVCLHCKCNSMLLDEIYFIPRGSPLHTSFDMIRNQATNLSDSKIPKDSSLDSCDSNDSKQDSL